MRGVLIFLSTCVASFSIAFSTFYYVDNFKPKNKYQIIDGEQALFILNKETGETWKSFYEDKDFGFTPFYYDYGDSKGRTSQEAFDLALKDYESRINIESDSNE